jgi:hypothetical protein
VSLRVILDEIDRRWPHDLPDLAHMWALDVAVALKPGQIYLDIGEVDDVFVFYNTFVDELNELAGEIVRNKCTVLLDGKPADTSTFHGGIQWMVKLLRNEVPLEICVTIRKSDPEYPVSRVLAQGRNEIQALLDLGRPDVVRAVIKTDRSDRDVLDSLGGIHAARQFGYSDADIAGWLSRGAVEPCEEEAMSLAGITVPDRRRRSRLRRMVPDNLLSLILRKK